jgi:hypothetical protein
VSDDNRDWYSPNLQPPAPRQPRPGELVWSLRNTDRRQVDCELRDHGSFGVEVQILIERDFVYGHRSPSRDVALMEADELKAAYLRDGGTVIQKGGA